MIVDSDRPGSKLVAYSPNGASLLATSNLGTWSLNAETGDEIDLLAPPGVGGGTSAASFSDDGTLVLISIPSASEEVFLYSAEGKLQRSFPLDTAVLSADGTKVAGWNPGRYTIYDAVTGKFLRSITLDEYADGRPIDLAFTPDGSRLVSGDHDNIVRVRDVGTGEVLTEMRGHSSPIRQVRVSRDGKYALTASDDGEARLWDLDIGGLVRVFPGHEGRAVTAIAFSPDGHTVAFGSSDGKVILSPVAQAELAALVCGRLRRDLSPDERIAYGIEGTTPTCQ